MSVRYLLHDLQVSKGGPRAVTPYRAPISPIRAGSGGPCRLAKYSPCSANIPSRPAGVVVPNAHAGSSPRFANVCGTSRGNQTSSPRSSFKPAIADHEGHHTCDHEDRLVLARVDMEPRTGGARREPGLTEHHAPSRPLGTSQHLPRARH